MDCIFCEIANKKIKAKIVWENEKFIAFENINPAAPVHILVIPKNHLVKENTISGKEKGIWDNLFSAGYEVIKLFKLDKTGYKIVINGAGYNHIDHEHLHILGGENWKPHYEP